MGAKVSPPGRPKAKQPPGGAATRAAAERGGSFLPATGFRPRSGRPGPRSPCATRQRPRSAWIR
ncbi:hypothetical protein F9Z44_01205 [Hydrogenophaga sp. PBL-H3]|nr:hypothetical protein F9Z45_01205 [Hydrogenophaga sp. PBL-H3]QHE79184.1 hypothetical protein F9Z44_01205 [Hydrogenophaga sp. PBL-H3]